MCWKWSGGVSSGAGLHTAVALDDGLYSVILTAPKLSLECRIDVFFLLDSSAGTTLEGFQRAKAFVKRFLQAVLSEDSRARVGVASYSRDLMVAVPVGEYQDVPDLVRRLDSVPFRGGPALTGNALLQVTEHGFGTASRTGQDRPRRVVVLLTESHSQDDVAGPADHARARELLLLGVGSEVVQAELEIITGSLNHVMVYTDPQDLFSQIPELQRRLCSQPRPGKVVQPDLGLACQQAGRAIFLLGTTNHCFL